MIRYPTKATLKKYGLTLIEWLEILNRQHGVCAVCKLEPSTGRMCVDHEHVRGWKRLSPERKKQYIRGLTCWVCNNRILTRGVTIQKLKNAVSYLEDYERIKVQC